MEIRAITEEELGAWAAALDASFLVPVPEGAVAFMRERFVPGRSLGAFAAGRCAGTLRSLDLEVTVPGGGVVAAEGVTNVAVIPAFRRRGLLTAMMRVALDDAVARGHGLAALIASEYRIYGRFGFGVATRTAACEVDVRRAGDVRVPGGAAYAAEPVSLAEAGESGPGLHERFRRTWPGAITRDRAAWRQRTGELRNPYRDWREPAAVLCRGPGGSPAGLALCHVDSSWRHGDPDFTLTVEDLFAVHPAAHAALWRYLLATEWVTRVVADNIALDDPLPLLLDNPRACVPRPGSGRDHLWLRILDAPRALQARGYNAPGRVVLDVTDRLGYAAGRYALETDSDGRACVTSTVEPGDLALDVSALSMVYLGDQTVHRLAAAGLVAEQHPGAIARADRMLRTTAQPWCPDGF